jgi:hypothetical protein
MKYLIIFFLLTGCATVVPRGTPPPVEPQLRSITRPPVIRRLPQGTYEVTDELVERATQLEEYNKRVREWRARQGY